MERATYSMIPTTEHDVAFLWELLSVAAVEVGIGPISPATAQQSPFGKYLVDWGRPGDAGVMAVDALGQRVGAAWYRLFPADHPAYGFIAPDVPELSIRVLGGYRQQGIGGALLDALECIARQQGYHALSLSVNRHNPARRLYARHHFRDAGISLPADSSVTLLKSFAS